MLSFGTVLASVAMRVVNDLLAALRTSQVEHLTFQGVLWDEYYLNLTVYVAVEGFASVVNLRVRLAVLSHLRDQHCRRS